MSYKGIDVSHWQGAIDFAKVKAAGFEFAIIKAGGADAGFYTDSNFERYYKAAVAAGLHVGAYYFTSGAFAGAARGKLEAEKFLAIIAGKKFDMPVYVDIEQVSPSVGKENITDAAIAFCETLEAADYYAGIYASDISGFAERMNCARLAAYDKWVARYTAAGPQYVKDFGVWQYGGSINKLGPVKVPGVASAACDQNIAYKDYPEIIPRVGLNGYKAAVNTDEGETGGKAEGTAEPTKYYKVTVGPMTAGDRITVEGVAERAGVPFEAVEV